MREVATGITKDTTLCISLSGRPGHTGTRFHNYLYDALGLDYVYKAFTASGIVEAIAGVRGLGIRGCAVSMPWKQDVIALVDELDPSAAAIESVNTVVNTDGHLTAYNTDYLAVAEQLRSPRVDPAASVAVLGSGGMAKATVAALRDGGFADVTVVGRNEVTGRALAERSGFAWAPELGALRPSVLVNCTPIGMAKYPGLPISETALRPGLWVADIVYFPLETALLAEARRRGCRTMSGGGMAVFQAVGAFRLFTGIEPDAERVLQHFAEMSAQSVMGAPKS